MAPSNNLNSLLARLGIGADENPAQYRNFLECQQEQGSDLEAELEQMVTIKKTLEAEMRRAAKKGKIVLHDKRFKYAWNKTHNYLEITTSNPQIIGVVTFSKSNTNPALTDFTGRAVEVLQEVPRMAKNQQRFVAQNLAQHASLLTAIKNTIAQEFQIWQDVTQPLKQRRHALKHIQQALQKFTIFLAIDLIKDLKGDPTYVPNSQEVEDKLQQMWEAHVEKASSTIRPAIFWGHRANDFHANSSSEWMIRCLFPLSNISSNARSLDQHKFNNHFAARDVVIVLDKTHKKIQEKAVESNRSAAAVGADHDKIPTLQATLTRSARDELIEILRSGQPIPQLLSVDLLYNTLLSPAVTKDTWVGSAAAWLGNKIGYKTETKKFFGEGNEATIFKNTVSLVNQVNKLPPFKFSEEDIRAIKSAVGQTIPVDAQFDARLREIKIKHKITHMNFPLNALVLYTHIQNYLGKYSRFFSSDMHKVNLKALRHFAKRLNIVTTELQKQLQAAIDEDRGNPNAIFKDKDLKKFKEKMAQIQIILDLSNRSYANKAEYDQMVAGVLKFLSDPKPKSKLKQDAKIFKIYKALGEALEHFNYIKNVCLDYGEFTKKLEDQKLSWTQVRQKIKAYSAAKVADYAAAASHAVLLQQKLGGVSLNSCKSGNDRTGLFYACLDSVLVTKNLSAEAVANSLQFGPGSFLVALNTLGSEFSGLQISANVLSAIPDSARVKELIDEKMSRAVGKIGQGMFSGFNQIHKCLHATDRIAVIQQTAKTAKAASDSETEGEESPRKHRFFIKAPDEESSSSDSEEPKLPGIVKPEVAKIERKLSRKISRTTTHKP